MIPEAWKSFSVVKCLSNMVKTLCVQSQQTLDNCYESDDHQTFVDSNSHLKKYSKYQNIYCLWNNILTKYPHSTFYTV